jgi:iron-sulfur cluster insertion protein
MTIAQSYTPTPIQISPTAVAKVRSLLEEEGNPDLKLRVYVTGGGCSGFQYGFSFDEESEDDDTRIEKDGIVVVVDPMSYPYLVGSRLDYQEGLQGSKFTVENPNAASTCGCGSSFSI